MPTLSPHPLATLTFKDCRVGAKQMLGGFNHGFKLAMRTLDVFRISVAAAALGLARTAYEACLDWVKTRQMFGQTLSDFQLTQAKVADMAVQIDTAALLVWRAAWMKDQGLPVTADAAMAKLTATENAQKVIDTALQLAGARGVVKTHVFERLYREIRAMRIYEGASDIQQLIIARHCLS